MVPYIYTKDELRKILLKSGITSFAPDDCREYMRQNGWTLRKTRKLTGYSTIVKHNGVMKRIDDFTGCLVKIGNDDKSYSAMMESKDDALLVCILMAIKNGSGSAVSPVSF